MLQADINPRGSRIRDYVVKEGKKQDAASVSSSMGNKSKKRGTGSGKGGCFLCFVTSE